MSSAYLFFFFGGGGLSPRLSWAAGVLALVCWYRVFLLLQHRQQRAACCSNCAAARQRNLPLLVSLAGATCLATLAWFAAASLLWLVANF